MQKENKKADSTELTVSGLRLFNSKLDLVFKINKVHCLLGLSGTGKSAILVDTLDFLSYQRISSVFARDMISRKFRNLKLEYDSIENLPPVVNLTYLSESGFKKQNLYDLFDLRGILSELMELGVDFWCKKDSCYFEDIHLENVVRKITSEVRVKDGILILGVRKKNLNNVPAYLRLFRENGFSRIYSENRFLSIDTLLDEGVKDLADFVLVHSVDTTFQAEEIQQRLLEMQHDFSEFGEEFCEIIAVREQGKKFSEIKKYLIGNGYSCPKCGQAINFIDAKIIKQLVLDRDAEITTYDEIEPRLFGSKIENYLQANIGELFQLFTGILNQGKFAPSLVWQIENLLKSLNHALDLNLAKINLANLFSEAENSLKLKLLLIYYLSSSISESVFVLDNTAAYIKIAEKKIIKIFFDLLLEQGNTIIFSDNSASYCDLSDSLLVLEKNDLSLDLKYYSDTAEWKNDFPALSQFVSGDTSKVKTIELVLNKNKFKFKFPAITALELGDGLDLEPTLETICKQIDLLKAKVGIKQIERLAISKSASLSVLSAIGLEQPVAELYSNLAAAHMYALRQDDFLISKSKRVCRKCEGSGESVTNIKDVGVVVERCDECSGFGFLGEILNVFWNDTNISNLFRLSIKEAKAIFNFYPNISNLLEPYLELGLDNLLLSSKLSSLSDAELVLMQFAIFANKKNSKQKVLITSNLISFLDNLQIEKLFRLLRKNEMSLIFFSCDPRFENKIDYLHIA